MNENSDSRMMRAQDDRRMKAQQLAMTNVNGHMFRNMETADVLNPL